MLAQINTGSITTGSHPPGWWIAVILIGIVALYVFIKVEHIILRLLAGGISLILIAVMLWWLFMRH